MCVDVVWITRGFSHQDIAHLNQNIVEAPLMRFIHENDSSSPGPTAADTQLVTLEKACPSSEEEAKNEDSQEIEAAVPSIMNSPLVKRRSHLKGVLQDTPKHRVSFQEEANKDHSPAPSRWLNSQCGPQQRLSSSVLVPAQNLQRYKSEWALSNDTPDAPSDHVKTPTRNSHRLRRYRSDLYLSRPMSEASPAVKQDSPEMERGVPEGQEDPQRIQSILNLSALQGNCISPTEEMLLSEKSKIAKGRPPSIGWNKPSTPSSVTTSDGCLPPRVERTLEDKRRWLTRARQKWSRSLNVDLPVPAPTEASVKWDGCHQAWKLEMDMLHHGHCQTNVSDADPLAKQLAQTLGLDVDDRYKCFPCHVDFFGGQPRPTYLLLGSKAMHVTLSQSNSLLWSAALFDIEQVAVHMRKHYLFCFISCDDRLLFFLVPDRSHGIIPL